MDQIKIGRFIAELRKEKNLTQRQLADSLNLSDKTISKWECGKGLPEVSLMLPLCEILEITVNELLCGERIEKEVYEEKAEETLVTLMTEQESRKKKYFLLLTVLPLISCIAVLFAAAGRLIPPLYFTYCSFFSLIFHAVITTAGSLTALRNNWKKAFLLLFFLLNAVLFAVLLYLFLISVFVFSAAN